MENYMGSNRGKSPQGEQMCRLCGAGEAASRIEGERIQRRGTALRAGSTAIAQSSAVLSAAVAANATSYSIAHAFLGDNVARDGVDTHKEGHAGTGLCTGRQAVTIQASHIARIKDLGAHCVH